MYPFKRILVPVDFSSCSEHAMALASQIARQHGGTLIVVHAWETPHFPGGDVLIHVPGLDARTLEAVAHDEAEKALRRFCEGHCDAQGDVTQLLMVGSPHRVILDASTTETADLIVMGAHGREGRAHLLMGSVAAKVI
ncbi:MAG: universal stress protein, partial [Myxococcales bacterium]|nr:universal stress protein [Myxococcales bacterium]